MGLNKKQQTRLKIDKLFLGEALRGLLLGDAYAFWTIV